MARIEYPDSREVAGEARELLEGVQRRLGMTPNMMRLMATSPAVLRGYLGFSIALAEGTLASRFREQIALVVAHANNSEYCLSRHTFIARRMGLSEGEIRASQQSCSDDAKEDAGLKFARELVVSRGQANDEAARRMRAAGYDDAGIVEVVANVALAIFANYFNRVAGTELDYPKAAAAFESNA
jgi:uncharacterized peroxidase-related enzyme